MNEIFASAQQADAAFRRAARQYAKAHGVSVGDALQLVFRTRLLARIFSESADR